MVVRSGSILVRFQTLETSRLAVALDAEEKVEDRLRPKVRDEKVGWLLVARHDLYHGASVRHSRRVDDKPAAFGSDRHMLVAGLAVNAAVTCS